MVKLKQSMPVAALAVIALLMAAFPASANQKKSRDSSEVRKIRAVLDRQVEAWNRRDLEHFMAGYLNSEDLTFFSGGSNVSGWQTTLDRYRSRYQSEGAEMGRLEFTDTQIEMLGPASAFVRGHWRLKMSSSEPGGLFTLIFRKLHGEWKIIHDHTSSS